MRFPMKKCYHTAKICLLLMLVVALLSLFEHWRGGKRTAKAQFSDPAEEEYEREILEDEARIIPELGEGGMAAQLTGEDKRLGEESEKKLAMNVYLSDRIPYNRTLKDYRNPACQRVVYDAELPSVSVIIIFHNEPYSVVVRTVWSVINSARRDNPWFKQANFVDMQTGRTMNLGYKGQDPSSPLVYLKEIILVDDNSTLPELKGKLSHYVRTRLPPDLIRILRLPDRQGLIIARIRGARSARGDVLLFLDAHCEGGADWLRPLLQRIRHKRDAVLTPVIDVIDQHTYGLQAADGFQVGGFTFMGHFTWIDVPEREKKRRGSNISPTWSPTMAGGLFAINREYYWELGAYDEQMAGWGGENLEMSFRIWQCGGTLETVPCSRVGHVFRSFHPYGLPAHTDTHGINTARMAEVWMDDYAELFYIHRPDLRKSSKIGDVTHRKVLREKLHCKSFQWYLDNIYQEKFVPVRDVFGYGRFSNPSSGLCLDSLQRSGAGAALGVYPCHRQLLATQYFSLSLAGQLRDEELCAELQYGNKESETTGRRVVMANCRGSDSVSRGQKWSYQRDGRLRHEESGLCLDAVGETGADVLARVCGDQPGQKWHIDYSEENGFRANSAEEPSEQEQRLQKLRGQRRISRSLLSHDTAPVVRGRKRHHKRRGSKRRRHSDRFILKLARTLMNGSEEHLEVDVHCKHRRLYPNNSFVRDLVTILNDKNIKVINNGRVFERNKVVPLSAAPSALRTERSEPRLAEDHHAAHRDHTTQDSLYPKRSQPTELRSVGVPAARAPPAATKIIIEDFVEITPATGDRATHRPVTKHKHKRHRQPSPLPPETPPETREGAVQVNTDKPAKKKEPVVSPVAGGEWNDVDHGDEDIGDVAPAEHSVEDQPMVGSSAEGGGVGGAWPTGEVTVNSTRILPLRRANCEHEHGDTGGRCREHEQTEPRIHARANTEHTEREKKPSFRVRLRSPPPSRELSAERWSARAEPGPATDKPVKVVVKSNLTFNFGDEFFDWKKDSDDIANMLGELAIPGGNTPEPVELQAWIKLHQPRGGRGQLAGPTAERGPTHAQTSNYEDKGTRSLEDQISTGRGHSRYQENSSSESSGE